LNSTIIQCLSVFDVTKRFFYYLLGPTIIIPHLIEGGN